MLMEYLKWQLFAYNYNNQYMNYNCYMQLITNLESLI